MAQLSAEQIRDKAFLLCKEYLHGSWNNVTADQIHVKQISGGLSNLLYLCSLPNGTSAKDGEPTRVLLRLYGQVHGEKEEALEGLLTEAVIFTLLSESQRGPRLFGVFPGGRLEEYIPARPLTTLELSNSVLSCKIAAKLAQIHAMRVPINKHPRWLWDTMARWLASAEQHPLSTLSDAAAAMMTKFRALDLKTELTWLRRELSAVNSPVVFCHNDLQEGNILLRDGSGDVVVIDFEYSAYNYRAFDFANHMCEWMYDYTNTQQPYFTVNTAAYPSVVQQTEFAHAYLAALPYEGKRTEPEEVDQLLRETKIFTLASHFFWALWSLVNGAISTIPFDYWVYGEARFEEYFKQKSLLLSSGDVTQ